MKGAKKKAHLEREAYFHNLCWRNRMADIYKCLDKSYLARTTSLALVALGQILITPALFDTFNGLDHLTDVSFWMFIIGVLCITGSLILLVYSGQFPFWDEFKEWNKRRLERRRHG